MQTVANVFPNYVQPKPIINRRKNPTTVIRESLEIFQEYLKDEHEKSGYLGDRKKFMQFWVIDRRTTGVKHGPFVDKNHATSFISMYVQLEIKRRAGI